MQSMAHALQVLSIDYSSYHREQKKFLLTLSLQKVSYSAYWVTQRERGTQSAFHEFAPKDFWCRSNLFSIVGSFFNKICFENLLTLGESEVILDLLAVSFDDVSLL